MKNVLLACVVIVAACGAHASEPTKTGSPAPAPAPAAPIEKLVTSGDAKLFVRISGPADGPLLLAIHGGPGISHEYLLGIEPLAPPHMRVVTYDQRSTGKSSPATSFSTADLVADIEAIRADLGVEQLHILGHSWGGFVALAYATAKPERVASLIFVSSLPASMEEALPGMAHQKAKIARLHDEGIIVGEMPASNGDDCGPILGHIVPAYFSNPRDPRMGSLGAHCSEAGGAAAQLMDKYDFRPAMKVVTMPTMVMTGVDDPFGVGWADALVAALTATLAHRVVLPSTGHFAWIEAPDRFRAEIAAFLPHAQP